MVVVWAWVVIGGSEGSGLAPSGFDLVLVGIGSRCGGLGFSFTFQVGIGGSEGSGLASSGFDFVLVCVVLFQLCFLCCGFVVVLLLVLFGFVAVLFGFV